MSNIIQTALCSFGMSGKVFHAPFLHVHEGFNFYGVWQRSEKNAGDLYPGVISFSSLTEMLANDKIELVIVNTPNYTHYDYAKQALLAGKHVLVEKPFVVTVTQGEELINIAKQKNKLLTVYHNRRFDSDYKTIKKLISQHVLGDIVEAEFHYDRYNEKLSPKVHKETPGPGTGALYDLGSHLIDQALQLFGMPDAVFADIFKMRSLSMVDDYFELLLYYPSKRVRLKATYVAREVVPSFVFHGLKGSFLKARTDVQENELQAGKLPSYDNWGIEPEHEKGLLHTEINGEIIKEQVPSETGNYLEYYDQLYSAITDNKPLPVTAEEGLNVIRIIEAAFESSQQRMVIDL